MTRAYHLKNFNSYLMLGTALSVVAMSGASAQDRPITPQPETIIVTAVRDVSELRSATATKTSTPNLETPFSISIVPETYLADRGQVDLREGLRSVPGAEPIAGIGAFNTRFRLRGFATTGNLRNGFRQSVAFPVTEVAGIERIEVLKGPSSSLYGRLEPGGAINIITKQAKPTPFTNASLSFDEANRVRGTVDSNFVFTPQMSLRLNGIHDTGESFRDNVINQSNFLAASFGFQLSDDTRFVLDADWLDRDGVFDRGFVAAPGLLNLMLALPSSRFLGDANDSFANQTQSVSSRVTHRLSPNQEMRIGIAYAKTESDGAYFFPVAGGAIAPLLSASGILNRRNQFTQDAHEDWAGQIDLVSQFKFAGAPQTLLLSFDWSKDEATSRITRATVNAPLNINAPIAGAIYSPVTANILSSLIKNEGYGGVIQLESSWTSWLRTTAALRFERAEGSFADRLTNVIGRAEDDAVTPRLGITILPSEGLALFANWGTSFNPEPGTRPIIDRAVAEPSQGEQIEIGVKWQDGQGRANVQLALFQIDKTNVRVAELAPSVFDRQSGAQRSNGAELEGFWKPIASVRFDGALTFTDARIRRDRVLTGRTLTGVPETSASIWGRWDINPKIGLGLGTNWVGKRFIDPANTFVLPGYQRVDAALFWQASEHIKVQANLLNAFDQAYFENGNTNNNFYPGQPRTLRVTLSWQQ